MIKVESLRVEPTLKITLSNNYTLTKPHNENWRFRDQIVAVTRPLTSLEEQLITDLLENIASPEGSKPIWDKLVTAWVPSLSKWVKAIVMEDATNPITGGNLDEKP